MALSNPHLTELAYHFFQAAPGGEAERARAYALRAGDRALEAAAYEEDLIARCTEIAAGMAMSQDCRRIIDPELPEDLRFARCGQHFVIFVEDAEQVIIVDFLHARSDLPRRLAALIDQKPDRDH